MTEIANGARISRQAVVPIVRKFLRWNLLKTACQQGNVDYYTLNEDSGFVEAFEDLNNRIIEQMLREKERSDIADCY